MSAIRVLRTRRENNVQQRDATLPGGDLDPGPGPHLDQNVPARYAAVAPVSILGLSGCLFSCRPHGPVSARSPTGRKRGTQKLRLETNPKNEARSALLARLWCHLIRQNRANRAENPTCLCSATICKTEWRMVQVGAIRSRQKAVQLLAEILNQKS